MAFARPAARKCDDYKHLDRETYKGVKANVCYLIEKKDDKPVAVAVTSKTPACQHWRN